AKKIPAQKFGTAPEKFPPKNVALRQKNSRPKIWHCGRKIPTQKFGAMPEKFLLKNLAPRQKNSSLRQHQYNLQFVPVSRSVTYLLGWSVRHSIGWSAR
ncbi:MAG: hypothetical protein GY739_22095, partial [Mesoflavibacter sp.]|nr:hypothetical protein [Mesoflavibacter sp.]